MFLMSTYAKIFFHLAKCKPMDKYDTELFCSFVVIHKVFIVQSQIILQPSHPRILSKMPTHLQLGQHDVIQTMAGRKSGDSGRGE